MKSIYVVAIKSLILVILKFNQYFPVSYVGLKSIMSILEESSLLSISNQFWSSRKQEINLLWGILGFLKKKIQAHQLLSISLQDTLPHKKLTQWIIVLLLHSMISHLIFFL